MHFFQKSSGYLKSSKAKSPKVTKPAIVAPTPEKTIEPLLPEATAQEVTQWLHHNRFSHYVKVFQNFAGAYLCCVFMASPNKLFSSVISLDVMYM